MSRLERIKWPGNRDICADEISRNKRNENNNMDKLEQEIEKAIGTYSTELTKHVAKAAAVVCCKWIEKAFEAGVERTVRPDIFPSKEEWIKQNIE